MVLQIKQQHVTVKAKFRTNLFKCQTRNKCIELDLGNSEWNGAFPPFPSLSSFLCLLLKLQGTMGELPLKRNRVILGTPRYLGAEVAKANRLLNVRISFQILFWNILGGAKLWMCKVEIEISFIDIIDIDIQLETHTNCEYVFQFATLIVPASKIVQPLLIHSKA